MYRTVFALCAALVPCLALAHAISNEAGAGAQPPTATSPSSGFLSDHLSAQFDVSEAWQLHGDLMVTDDLPSPPRQGARFGSTGGVAPNFALGAEWNANDHFSLGADLNYSPATAERTDAQVQVTRSNGSTVLTDADLRMVSSSEGAAFNVGLDSAGDGPLETAGQLSVGLTRFTTRQSIVDAVAAGSTYLNELHDRCMALAAEGVVRRPECSKGGTIDQGRIGVSVTETVLRNWDLTLSGAYYLYDQDPTTVGYFSQAMRARVFAGGSFAFGEGLAIAPYELTVRPEVAVRLGDWKLDLAYQYGQYVPGEGYSHQLAARVDWKLSRSWKVWVSALVEKDTDGSGNATLSESGTAGVRFKW